MKSQFQTLSFLSNYTPQTDLDGDFINSFLAQYLQTTPKTAVFAPNFDGKPLDAQSFISWFKNGSEALKIAKFKNQLILLGNCTLDTCDIIGSLLPDGSISTEKFTVTPEQISEVSEQEEQTFKQALLDNGLQPSPTTMQLVPKFIPELGNRVIFYDFSINVQGVGVVREITDDDNVIFFCYFIYPTSTQPKRIGYNLHENIGVALQSFVFENIDKEGITSTLGESTSCFRRLGRELNKVGKVWKDKLHRIEPLGFEPKPGSTYYYITDKLDVKTDHEKGVATSRMRYLAGNYFTNIKTAYKMENKIRDLLKDYLASDAWPEMED